MGNKKFKEILQKESKVLAPLSLLQEEKRSIEQKLYFYNQKLNEVNKKLSYIVPTIDRINIKRNKKILQNYLNHSFKLHKNDQEYDAFFVLKKYKITNEVHLYLIYYNKEFDFKLFKISINLKSKSLKHQITMNLLKRNKLNLRSVQTIDEDRKMKKIITNILTIKN